MAFSTIFASNPTTYKKSKWIQILYETVFGYLWVNHTHVKIGALFTLYTLYQTQPKPNKCKINLSIGIWKQLKQVVALAFPNTNHSQEDYDQYYADVLAVYTKLYRDEAFCIYAQAHIIPPPSVIVKPVHADRVQIGDDYDTVLKSVDFEAIQSAHDIYISDCATNGIHLKTIFENFPEQLMAINLSSQNLASQTQP